MMEIFYQSMNTNMQLKTKSTKDEENTNKPSFFSGDTWSGANDKYKLR